MLYVCIFLAAEGSYRVGLSDFIEPHTFQAGVSTRNNGHFRLGRAFAFADASLAAVFYERVKRMDYHWLERLVTHGLPDKSGSVRFPEKGRFGFRPTT